MTEVSKEIIDKVLEAIEVAKATGKIKKGTNEVTKALERGTAKLVAVAKDASPAEIVMHIPLLSEEKGVPCVTVPTKEELGASTGIAVSTASAAITVEGESKKLIAEINDAVSVKKAPKKEEAAPEEEAKPEEKKEAKKETAPKVGKGQQSSSEAETKEEAKPEEKKEAKKEKAE
ncbi:50S ribosomal protein L7ae [Candidatus Woesearchaeota archaeon]|nr:50S ribosomal protein L7ae [Candidatus Woesearchaeota archaeon]